MKVTPAASRPAGRPDQCFYCRQWVGEEHLSTCVLRNRTVRLRMTVEYDVDVPAHWDNAQIHFHRHDSSWCADSALAELEKMEGCLCGNARFEVVQEYAGVFLDEK